MNQPKSKYNKPKVLRVDLDKSISLVMMTVGNPDPRSGTKGNPKSDPFESPFNDSPFG